MSSSGPHQVAPLVLGPLLALGIVSFALAHQSRAYFPIGIDRLLVDQHTYVEVTGSVLVVTQTDDGTTTFRIRDSRNRSLSCIIPKGSTIAQPKVGALVKVSGVKNLLIFEERPAVAEIDPVEKLEPAE